MIINAFFKYIFPQCWYPRLHLRKTQFYCTFSELCSPCSCFSQFDKLLVNLQLLLLSKLGLDGKWQCPVLVSIQTPPCFILKRVTGHSARVNPLLFTRVSGTRCNVHSSPFLTNSKSVCQRPSERAHIHRALHTVSGAHARTDAHRHVGSLCRNIEDRRGKGSGELPFICPQLPSLRLLVSFWFFLSTNARILLLLLLPLLSRTKGNKFKDQTGVCKIILTAEQNKKKKKEEMDKRSNSGVWLAAFFYFVLWGHTDGQFFPGSEAIYSSVCVCVRVLNIFRFFVHWSALIQFELNVTALKLLTYREDMQGDLSALWFPGHYRCICGTAG